MINTRLIILEGMPATGKSTNSSFLLGQLERNGKKAKWIHEVAIPHPTSYFNEACLTYDEYSLFIKEFPHCKEILDSSIIKRRNTVGVDLLKLERNHAGDIGEKAMEVLKQFDVWSFSLDRYEEIALEKWSCFVEDSLREGNEILLLESSIFQFQIFTFLLKNVPYKRLETFVQKLFKIIEPLNPVLIYLYRKRVEDSIAYLEGDRGTQYLEYIWNRDKNEPYYQDRPQGAEGCRQFLMDYGRWVFNLFEAAPCRKVSIDISQNEWKSYEQRMLTFLDIKDVHEPDSNLYVGVFSNKLLGARLRIDKLTLIDPAGKTRKLTPKAVNEFYVQYLPVVLRFTGTDSIIVDGEQIGESWASIGAVYSREL